VVLVSVRLEKAVIDNKLDEANLCLFDPCRSTGCDDDVSSWLSTTPDKLDVFYGTTNLLDYTDGRILRDNQYIVSEKGKIITRLKI
jgi:hypothetical protein